MNCKVFLVLSFSIVSCITSPLHDVDNFIESYSNNFNDASLVFLVPEIGQNLKLECPFTRNNQDARWDAFVNRKHINFHPEDISETAEASFLTIKNITKASMGDYFCERGFEIVSFYILPARTNAFIDSSRSQVVEIGSDVELTCNPNPGLFVKPHWIFRGKTGTEMNSKLKMIDKRKTIIENFSSADEGIYECRYKSMFLEMQSIFIKLSLKSFNNEIEVFDDNVEVVSFLPIDNPNIGFVSWIFPQPDQSLTFRCNIPQNRNHSFWGQYIDDHHVHVVNDSMHVASIDQNNVLTLNISSFNESMYGSFFCVHDSVSSDAFHVLPFPEETSLPFTEIKNVHLSKDTTLLDINMTTTSMAPFGDNFTLTCATETPHSDEIQWYRNGTAMLMISRTDAFIEDFSPDDEGLYECRIASIFKERVSLFVSFFGY